MNANELSQQDALAAIARVRAGTHTADDMAAVLSLATEQAKTIPLPIDPAVIVRSRRQQERFLLAERHGWKGGRDHRTFIPPDELAAFDAETARQIAATGGTE